MEVVARRAHRADLDGIVSERELRKQLNLYRALLAFLVVGAAALYFARDYKREPAVQVFDVANEVDELASETPDWLDIVPAKYFKSEAATVHLHVMGRDQTCPLHIHAKTEEATVIVKGSAEVTHVFAKDGALAEQTTHPPPGTLLYSPTYCGHEWKNASKTEHLGNLVFTAPPFIGNHYVKKDHPLLLRGAAPFVLDVDAEIAAAQGKRRETPVPMGAGKLRLFVLPPGETLAAKAKATIVFALRGKGTLDAGEAVPLMPYRLVVVRERAVSVRPSAEGPLAVLAFEPP